MQRKARIDGLGALLVEQVLARAEEHMEPRYELQARGYDLDN